MDKWLFWRLWWVLPRAAGTGGVGDKRTMPRRNGGIPGRLGRRPCLAPGAVRLDLRLYVAPFRTVARAMQN